MMSDCMAPICFVLLLQLRFPAIAVEMLQLAAPAGLATAGAELAMELREDQLIELEASMLLQTQANQKRETVPRSRISTPPTVVEAERRAVEMQHEADLRREARLAAKTPAPTGAVLHFLFMANDGLPLASFWRTFFEAAPSDSWRASLHCMNVTACKASRTLAEIPQIRFVPTVPSEYCVDLQAPMVQLLEHALSEPTPASGIIQKFIFLSDSTLPVKPFQYIYNVLASNEYSDFCFQLNAENSRWPTAHLDGMDLRLVKHSQWVVLSRRDAVRFMDNWVPGANFQSGWQVPLGPRAREFIPSSKFLRTKFFGHEVGCIDEFAFFNSIYGAFAVGHSGSHYYEGLGHTLTVAAPAALTLQGRCRTFTGWDPSHPDEAGQLLARVMHDGASNVTPSTYLHGYEDVLKAYPVLMDFLPATKSESLNVSSNFNQSLWQEGFDHSSILKAATKIANNHTGSPALFNVVSERSMAAFRDSTYLFARKFAGDAVLPGFSQIALSP